MGANGAGKSTLVKILTGAVRPDAGTILLRGRDREGALARRGAAQRHGVGVPGAGDHPRPHGRARTSSSPRRPSSVPRPDRRPRHRRSSTCARTARDLPLATLRVIDLARALAIEPDVLLLDEMTAALPADLTARVLEVVGQPSVAPAARVIFISHRMLEVAGAVRPRDGAARGRHGRRRRHRPGRRGADRGAHARAGGGRATRARSTRRPRQPPRPPTSGAPACGRGRSRAARNLSDVSFDLHAGEVLGLVALEGQGQDELFDVLSGQLRPEAGELVVDGRAKSHSAIRRTRSAPGIVLVPGDRDVRAPHAALGAREHRAAGDRARLGAGGSINTPRREARGSAAAIDRLQIDTRAQSEVRRLSGGNQQKVTIARWLESGVRTFLFYDPTRGIDIRTKREIYQLVRELAAAGAAVLLLTSELEEIQRACDRAIVIFGGRVVDEMAAARGRRADAAAGCPRPASRGRASGRMTGRHDLPDAARRRRAAVPRAHDLARSAARVMGGDAWTIGLVVVLRRAVRLHEVPAARTTGSRRSPSRRCPSRSPRPDRRSSSSPAGSTCRSARSSRSRTSLRVAAAQRARALGADRPRRPAARDLLVGLVNGVLVVVSRVPDIVVTLAMSFVWAGAALLVLGTPGGDVGRVAAEPSSTARSSSSFVPRALVVLLVIVGLVWIPLRRSRLGLSIYAIGSERAGGVPQRRERRRGRRSWRTRSPASSPRWAGWR